MNTAFQELIPGFLQRPGCNKGTMMGYPCLRRDKKLFACSSPTGAYLIIKLSAARVSALKALGEGEDFAPNGGVFREWLAIPVEKRDRWETLMEEAWQAAL